MNKPEKDNTANRKNLNEDPYYFAHYLNMAEHNVYVILKTIDEKAGINGAVEEKSLYNSTVIAKLKSKSAWEVKSLLGRLKQNFPFFAIYENEPEKIYETLYAFLRILHILRNRYSHYAYAKNWLNANDKKHLESTFLSLKRIFNNSIDKIKDRFEYSDEETAHLKFNKKSEEPYHYFISNKDNSDFEERGLAFFTSLFLEKKYANLFLSRLSGFKRTDEKQYRATKNCFMAFCCQLPKPKIRSDNNTMSLMLDMMGELQRCPRELYKQLNTENQNLFLKGINETGMNEDVELSEKQEVILKRYSNRFPYFDLRFLEETKAFDTLRFHIHLGRYICKEYTKPIKGEDKDRRLTKELQTYGFLSDFIEQKDIPQTWKDTGTENVLIKEIEQFSPSYQISGNRIAFKFIKDNEVDLKEYYYKVRVLWPILKGKETKLSKPDGIISTHDLSQMLFLHLLDNKAVESVIKEWINHFNRFLQDVSNDSFKPIYGSLPLFNKNAHHTVEENDDLKNRKELLEEHLLSYQIKIKDIPDSIREYLLGYFHEPDIDFIKRKLKEKLEEIKDLQSKLKKEISRRKKKQKSKLRNGDIATYIASDIVMFTPNKDGKGKINNVQYSELQGSLALFSTNKNSLLPYYEELGLLGETSGHHFLKNVNVNESEGLLMYFEKYLRQKEEFLKSIKSTIESFENVPEKIMEKYNELFYFFKPPFISETEKGLVYKGFSPANIKSLAGRMKSDVKYLPRGIFNKAIKEALKEQGIELEEKHNIIFAIEQYLNYQPQNFYDFKRDYKLSNQEEDHLKEKTNIELKDLATKYKDAAELETPEEAEKRREEKIPTQKELYRRFKRNIIENEKKIRFTRANDKLLFEMTKKLAYGLGDFENKIENWQLNHFSISNDDNKKNNILDNEMEMTLKIRDKKINDILPFKRYGEFRRFLKDRRLDNLLKHFKEDEIKREILENEINVYERKREEIFEVIYHFEKTMYEKYENELNEERKEKQIPHTAYLNVFYSHFPAFRKDDVKDFKELRNKFIHNKFPLPELFPPELITEKGIANSAAGFVTDKYLTYTKMILQ